MTPREQELLQAVNELRSENALLRQKIDLLVKRVFGSSSEQLDRNQLELLMQLPEGSLVEAIVAAPEKKRAERSRQERTTRLPENLPVVEEVIDPEPVKAQPGQWRCIGQEVSEQLDYEPGRFLRKWVSAIGMSTPPSGSNSAGADALCGVADKSVPAGIREDGRNIFPPRCARAIPARAGSGPATVRAKRQ